MRVLQDSPSGLESTASCTCFLLRSGGDCVLLRACRIDTYCAERRDATASREALRQMAPRAAATI